MTDLDKTQKNYGLRELPDDDRDFRLGKILGLVPIDNVPLEDFMVAWPLAIKDQGYTDFCTAFATAAVSEDQEEILLDPFFSFAKTKKIEGNYKTWGATLRDACKALVKYGSLPAGSTPFDITKVSRDFMADWKNWTERQDAHAIKHKKQSYFKVTGPNDIFDNIRAALWQGKDPKQSIVAGCIWRPSWTDKSGIIPKEDESGGFGHAFCIRGQKMIDGEPYLVVQNSYGIDWGKSGYNFFPREVVNRDFRFGIFQFYDMDPKDAKILNETGLSVKWLALAKFISLLKNLFKF